MEYNIRKAVPGDLQDIMGLVASSVGKMRACGNWSQWSETYPGKSIIANDIQEGTCYVILDGSEAVGSFVFKPDRIPHTTKSTRADGLTAARRTMSSTV